MAIEATPEHIGRADAASARTRFTVAASLTIGLLFAGGGIYMPFFPVWLQAQGFNSHQIGYLLAVPMVMRVLSTAPLSRLGDTWLGPRRTLLIFIAGTVAGYAGLLLGGGFWAVALSLGAMAVLNGPAGPLLDVIILNGVKVHGGDYGFVRQWGSTAWLVMSLLAGVALSALPASAIPATLAGLALLALIPAWFLPEDKPAQALAGTHPGSGTAPPALVLTVLALALACFHGSHAFIFGFGTIIWRDAGIGTAGVGLLWAIGVGAEVVFFLLARRFGSMDPLRLVLIGGVAALVRWSILAFEPPFAVLLALQTLHGLTYGAVHIGTLNWLMRYSKGRAGRQGLLASAIGAGLTLLTAGSGYLFDGLGAYGYFAMSAVVAVGLGLVLLVRRMERPKLGEHPVAAIRA